VTFSAFLAAPASPDARHVRPVAAGPSTPSSTSGFATCTFGGDGRVVGVTLSELGDPDGGRLVAKPR
jgi:hypothetical protein